MAAMRIVEALDEVEYGYLALSKGLEVGAIDAFGFERAPKRLGHGGVVAVGIVAHARDQMRIGKSLAIFPGRILRAAIGMMN
ncbi:MAG: hypothetical protein JWL90_3764 [Chthoniobacteraceae bacterium]|nr:hypothetical protein [Chthoniobacteraceae bacterium]